MNNSIISKNVPEIMNIGLISLPKISKGKNRILFEDMNNMTNDTFLQHKQYMNTYPIEVNDVKQNILVLLLSMKQRFFANINPKIYNINNATELIAETINNMRNDIKKSYDDVFALVTGGVHYLGNPEGDKSVKLIDEIYETLVKDEGVPTTIIAEQKIDLNNSNSNGINLYSRNNKIRLYDGIINNLKGKDITEPEAVENSVNELFDFVEFSKNTPIDIKSASDLSF